MSSELCGTSQHLSPNVDSDLSALPRFPVPRDLLTFTAGGILLAEPQASTQQDPNLAIAPHGGSSQSSPPPHNHDISQPASQSLITSITEPASSTTQLPTQLPAGSDSLQSAQPESTSFSASVSSFFQSGSSSTINLSSNGTSSTFVSTAPVAPPSSRQSTVLLGSSSRAGLPTSSSSSASMNAAAISHRPSFYAGLAFAGFAILVIVGLLFLWWLRVRTPCRRSETLSWTNGQCLGDNQQTEQPTRGMMAGWWGRRVGKITRTNQSHRLPQGSSVDPFMDPPAAAFRESPYPTIRTLPLEMQNSCLSVRDIRQDVGELQVANLVSGDIVSSGDETSRHTSMEITVSEFGTPRELSTDIRPRYLGVDDGGLTTPWTPLQLRRTGRWKARLEADRHSTDDELDLKKDFWVPPLPRPIAPVAKMAQGSSQPSTWTNSLKANFANALNIFSTGPSSHRERHAVPPPTFRCEIGRMSNGCSSNTFPLSRSSIMMSKPWTFEETGNGAGIVHIRSIPSHPSTLLAPVDEMGMYLGGFFERDVAYTAMAGPPPVLRKPGRRAQFSERPPYVSSPSASSQQSTASKSISVYSRARGRRSDRYERDLPPLAPFARDAGLASPGVRRLAVSRLKPSIISRHSSSAKSATSVGSDMTRTSSCSTRFSKLTEREKAARRALRKRRKRPITKGQSGQEQHDSESNYCPKDKAGTQSIC